MKEILSNTFSPLIVFEIFLTSNTSLPCSLSGLKSTYGYFLFEGLISSSSIFSKDFFLDVACLDLEALALNLAIKSCNSFILSSFFFSVSFLLNLKLLTYLDRLLHKHIFCNPNIEHASLCPPKLHFEEEEHEVPDLPTSNMTIDFCPKVDFLLYDLFLPKSKIYHFLVSKSEN